MSAIIGPLQRFFLPATILLLIYLLYRIFVKKDRAAGLVLLIPLIVIVDQYMQKSIPLPFLEKGSIRYDEILLMYLLVQQAKKKRLPHEQAHPYYSKAIFLFSLYVAFFLIAVLRGESFLFLTDFRFQAVYPFLVYFAAARGFDTEGEYRRFGFYLLFFSLILAAASIQSMLFDRYFIRSPLNEDKFYHAIVASRRFASFYLNPNHLGGFLALSFPLFFSLFFLEKGLLKKGFLLVSISTLLFTLVKTYSRGAFLGFASGMLVFMLFPVKQVSYAKKILFTLAVSLVLFVMVPSSYESAFKRLSTMSQESATELSSQATDEDSMKYASRAYIWLNTIKIIEKNPFGIGLGLNNYVRHLESVRGVELDNEAIEILEEAEHPHNSYLYIALFIGLPALFCFVYIIWLFFRASLLILNDKFFLRASTAQKQMVLPIMCGVFGFLVAIFFDFQLFVKGSCVPFWILMGINFSNFHHQYPIAKD